MKQQQSFGIIDEIEKVNPLLRDRFLEPPFSVLDTKQDSWQDRKRAWLALGIKSETGRNAGCMPKGFDEAKYGIKQSEETSIFDASLTELMYRWFCPDKGDILDPFAGGSVRGIVANYLGYYYTGVELRQEQVDSNRTQAMDILPLNNQPNWYVGDTDKILEQPWNKEFDFIFSCPPYGNLEVYSDLPDDLSNMDYSHFVSKLSSIIKKSVQLLKSDCYACFVVSDFRDKQGFYYDFTGDTKKAFSNAGCKLYNEAILLNCIGTAPIRAPHQFQASKKLVKVHQNVLIFKKVENDLSLL